MRQKTLLLFFVFLSATLFGQNVYIPDANFKDYLVGNSAINTNNDNEIQVSEANSFDGQIQIFEQYISDLTGLEAFTSLTKLILQDNSIFNIDVSQNIALERLVCADNYLTSLDVSQNTALTELYCYMNQITSLDVSNNTSLTLLSCFTNQLSQIDVSQNTNLEALSVSSNQLTSLDVSQNTAMTYLECNNNQLTTLDVSQNNILSELHCRQNELTCLNVANGNNINFNNDLPTNGFYVDFNPNLTCIEVDNVNWANANWGNQLNGLSSPQAFFSENCYNECLISSSLTELSTSRNLIQILDMMGRETSFKPNTPLIYVYDDGSTEKVFSVGY